MEIAGDLTVTGKISGATKSFVIDHPYIPNTKLWHGSLEGPEYGIYVRGIISGSEMIQLPKYWEYLVDENSMTVNLTSIGEVQNLYVKETNLDYV